MKRTLTSIVFMLLAVVAACTVDPATPGAPPAVTEAPGAPPAITEAPPAPTAASELVPTPSQPVENVTEPGGIEVALSLVDIPDQETIAIVNGEEISTAAYQEELEFALESITMQYGVNWNDPESASFLPTLQEQVLEQVIERVLLHQLADQDGITVDPAEIEAEIDSAKAQILQDGSFADWDSFLAQNNLTEEDVRSLIADNLLIQALIEEHGVAQVVEQVHASHILVETEETGQEVLDKLAAGEEFESLAAEYSIDPGSSVQGGDLGWFPQGVMVPEFEEAAFSLKPGETSGLVQTDFGYHIIRVYEKEEREMDPTFFAQFQQQQFQIWLETQRAEANIERLYTFQADE